MFERFTDQARQVVVSARREARELRHSYVGSEHLLLGLLREDKSLAARALTSLDVTLDRARAQVRQCVGSAEGPSTFGEISFTPHAREVLARAGDEASRLGRRTTGTEHILLGLASVSESEAMYALAAFDIDAEKLRAAVIELLPGAKSIARASIPRAVIERPAAPTDASVSRGGARVGHRSEMLRLLMGAAARALEDGRSEMTGEDLLIALTRDPQTAPLLARLGVSEARIRRDRERHGAPEEPPAAVES